MENIRPALMALHLFGFASWFAGALMQYLFLNDLKKNSAGEWLAVNLHLLKKSFHYMIWPGVILMVTSGTGMLVFYGWNWMSPRIYIFIKIGITVFLLLVVHLLWNQYNRLGSIGISSGETGNSGFSGDGIVHSMKNQSAMMLAGLAILVFIAVYRFGF